MRRISDQYKHITDLKVMQKMLCDFMQELHEICEANGLTYSLFGGSLLGAVRHQNIIPWDDDIDIIMPRPDFDRLIKIIQTSYADQYTFYNFPKENYIYPFGKICKNKSLLFENSLQEKFCKLGLYIDIFPLDGIPDISDHEKKKIYTKAEKYKVLVAKATAKLRVSHVRWKKPFIIFRWVQRTLLSIFGYKFFLKREIKITSAHSFDDCDNVAFVSSWGGGEKTIISKKEFYDKQLYRFGEYEFWGIKSYDKFLGIWYGDYMTPPPPNKRIAPHNYDLYVKKEFLDEL